MCTKRSGSEECISCKWVGLATEKEGTDPDYLGAPFCPYCGGSIFRLLNNLNSEQDPV